MEEFDEVAENSIEENDYYIKLKIMLLGDSTVGKTSILRRYCKNEFSNKYATTIGIDFQFKNMIKFDKRIRLQIWDTAGQERYKVVAKNYFNSSDGFVILYDITNKESFQNVTSWISQINDIASKAVKFILFGNKNDLEEARIVKKNEGENMAKKYSMLFYETSAKTGENINEGFDFLVNEILKEDGRLSKLSKKSDAVDLTSSKKGNNKRGCC